MNSHHHIQNALNQPPLQAYSPNINPSTQQVEVGTRTKRNSAQHSQNKQPRKSKTPAAKRLANTKQLNYQQWLEIRKQGEPYRVCRRVNILRDYPDDKTKLYPRN
ncbi:hypothetical protein EGT42_04805 [Acinetobacter haemolyticus]|nr:hypothetical protein EGT42_04805 [Acinetobacter haemolyticus]